VASGCSMFAVRAPGRSPASQAADGGLRDALDVVAEDLAVAFGATLAEALAALAASRHGYWLGVMGGYGECRVVGTPMALPGLKAALGRHSFLLPSPTSPSFLLPSRREAARLQPSSRSFIATPLPWHPIPPCATLRTSPPEITPARNHGPHQADRPQVHRWQGAPQAARHQGATPPHEGRGPKGGMPVCPMTAGVTTPS
jgi:hypothetical protein